jgi:MoxR-like ATPase
VNKLQLIRAELQARFLERDDVVHGLMAALVAREHVLLLGPPGTAKSMLAAELCSRVEDATLFSWLLTRFSTPEELFGAISLKALEQDQYIRVTDGRLPEAHIAFLDEVFKANSAILNSLLALMNERVFHNGGVPQPTPLQSLVGASNELPEEGELQALYDRFLVRFTVDYIQEDFRFLKLLNLNDDPGPRTVLPRRELEQAQRACADVVVPDGILRDLVEVRSALRAKQIIPSDRRFRKAVHLLRAYAVVDGRDHVVHDDTLHLRHVLWNDPSEQEEVELTVRQILCGHEEAARAVLAMAQEVRDYALRRWPDAEVAMRAGIEAHTKLRRLHTQATEIVEDARGRGRDVSAVTAVLDEIETLQRQVLEEGR